jgi:PST family polysaccharide transporter
MLPQTVSYTSTLADEQSEPSIAMTDNWRADSLVHSVVLWLVLLAVQRAVGFLRSILFCRWLDAGELGLWDMTFGFLMFAGPLAMLALPGTFGRYAEYYRLRGQLRPFLIRTAAACVLLTLAAAALIVFYRGEFSRLIFGSPRQTELVVLTAAVLIAVAAYNYFLSLLTALRKARLAATMEFLNGVLFAVLGIGLLLTWRRDCLSAAVAYGGSCLLSVVVVSWGVKAAWHTSPAVVEPLPRRAMWAKLIPFAAWILFISMLTNLFGLADRYMIIHFAPGPVEERLALVGQYYSSRVAPLLMVSVASMMATVLLPHLCHDWESGRRDLVERRLNLFLKLLTFGLMAASAAVLLIAPWLFGVAFQGKFAAGMAVLPWTLAYCVCFGTAAVAQQYLWCAERAKLIGLALGSGLAMNIALNLALLPRYGLLGAVLSASAANVIALVLTLVFARLAGFHVHRGIWIMLGLVPAICLGPWAIVGVLLAITLVAIRSEQILTREEKRQLSESIKHNWKFLIEGVSRRPFPFARGTGGEGRCKP